MSLEIESRLGYVFKNASLLTEALTHPSAALASQPNYQRLEFLGDRVLSLVVARLLIERFPFEAEGDLAKRHAALVTEYRALGAGQRVLDAGCGLGGPGRYLADRFGCAVIGVDVLPAR